MKAAVCRHYGSPEYIQIEDVPVPAPRAHQVLIRVRAASVNPLDWGTLQGKPLIMRLVNGLSRPRTSHPGVDLAGEVVTNGPGATQYVPGECVFGTCVDALNRPMMKSWIHSQGSWAEFVTACEDALVPMPSNVSFAEAASVPLVAFTALQSLRDVGRIQPSSKVLINGASGGVGTVAVQIAAALDGEITAVCGARNRELVHSLGASEVLDYAETDVTLLPGPYDIILDCVGNLPPDRCKKMLSSGGVCVLIGELTGRSIFKVVERMVTAWRVSRHGTEKVIPFLARPRKADLRFIAQLMQTGKLRGIIDHCYSFKEIPEAIRYLDRKHVTGKLIILI